jgi:hypothetical protein
MVKMVVHGGRLERRVTKIRSDVQKPVVNDLCVQITGLFFYQKRKRDKQRYIVYHALNVCAARPFLLSIQLWEEAADNGVNGLSTSLGVVIGQVVEEPIAGNFSDHHQHRYYCQRAYLHHFLLEYSPQPTMDLFVVHSSLRSRRLRPGLKYNGSAHFTKSLQLD